MTPDERHRILAAVERWFTAKQTQATLSLASGRAQGGTRSSVTGGTHLDGFNSLIVDELDALGLSGLTFGTNRAATLPGYYRASKSWDLLVQVRGVPLLAVEYKSMQGSEGKNLNNRSDEVFGVAEDTRQAQRAGLLPPGLKLAYVFVMEATPAVLRPVRVLPTAGAPDPAFNGVSYLDRMSIMCERIRETGLYDLTWALAAERNPVGFFEPNPSVGWDQFAEDLTETFNEPWQPGRRLEQEVGLTDF